MARVKKAKYVATVGLSLDKLDLRIEQGDPIPASVPEEMIKFLVKHGDIEEVPDKKEKK